MHSEPDSGLTPEERRLAARLRSALDEGSSLDAVTSARLSAAARRALAAATPRARAPRWAGAAVAATVIAAVLLSLRPTGDAPLPAVALDESHEWLLEEEAGPEFYRNLDFYEDLDHEVGAG
jgi:hypothetical protein